MRLVPRRGKGRGDNSPERPESAEPTTAQTLTEPADAPVKRSRRGNRRRRGKAGPADPAATLPVPQAQPTAEMPAPKPKDPRAAERARRAAALRRTQEQRRERAKRLQTESERRPRSGLLALILTLGILIAAVAVTGALIATSRQNKPVPLTAPLYVYPVTQVVAGACTAGIQGISGQTTAGISCYQLSSGIAIRKVADLRVQRGGDAGSHDVAISLLSADRRAFATLTRGAVGRNVAFVVRDQLVTAPRVDMPITGGKIVVTGRFSRQDADRLVRTLRGS